MTRLTGQQLKEQFKSNPKETTSMLSAQVQKFYPCTSPELIEKEINAQLAGAKPSNFNYGVWIERYLREGINY
jgi:hypothetical protein